MAGRCAPRKPSPSVSSTASSQPATRNTRRCIGPPSSAKGAVVAMGLAKRVIDDGLGRPLAEGLDLERDAFVEVFGTDDASTGVSSRSWPTVPARRSSPAADAVNRQARARRVRLTVAMRSSPHGKANTIGTSTPWSEYACTASRTCCSSPMIWIASTQSSLIASSAPSRSRAAQRFWKCWTSSTKPARSNCAA